MAEEYGWSYADIEETPIGIIEQLAYLTNEIHRQKKSNVGTRQMKKEVKQFG